MLRRCGLIANKLLFDSTLIVNSGSKLRVCVCVKVSPVQLAAVKKVSPSTACCCQKAICLVSRDILSRLSERLKSKVDCFSSEIVAESLCRSGHKVLTSLD